ncbi:hypothetical protein PHYBLDRAFT_61890 [Phycomyces blakesleeanus NRRL 1555(-)]|uniref:Uncharacterized protein n=1 Tax=Phycomyces blakesleeanus (strain ATCC 8743b / DSM 1359 / FGSC 10004 / NBRC 33097 / NRRL 1555) TaxID=763407 RepID=A0A162Q7W6_PHYB8|nr:hypothetical protein PHYBLDRAFT_61890 [Phycomyces blakesleeanus NRRL 1555(-)]OAD80836.1 hypothetical protein PHYBLDRAFT_61890 [Phycomyces blakesleeanus NRRL 1555(-)]|eukprot:XP_018298876.1 hypothetical protein PHYBLDRAFT_61890 [Phycomyces blakesleeanus NRRL 1555(-)]
MFEIGIQAALISLKSGQEALLGHQEALEKKQDTMQLQMTSFYNEFKDREFPDRTIVTSTSLFHLFRILEQTLAGHCFLKRIKTGCVSIIPSYSETMESIIPDATETRHQLQGLASSGEGVRSENTLVSSYLVEILASTIHE